jgi:hypothetical protein
MTQNEIGVAERITSLADTVTALAAGVNCGHVSGAKARGLRVSLENVAREMREAVEPKADREECEK